MSEENNQDNAVELFRALGGLVAEGRIALGYDFKRLQHMDCPVASEADANLWAYGTVAAALVALWLGGWWIAGAVSVAGVALYFTLGQFYVRRRIRRRVAERALESLDVWQRLWRFGGITLAAREGATCAAPAGNWMEMVRGLRVPSPPSGAERVG